MSNTSGVEEANFPIFDFLKFSALCHILSFLTPRDSPVFSDVRIYFSGAILQSQSLIGRTKFPARAAASLKSKAFSALAGSDTFVAAALRGVAIQRGRVGAARATFPTSAAALALARNPGQLAAAAAATALHPFAPAVYYDPFLAAHAATQDPNYSLASPPPPPAAASPLLKTPLSTAQQATYAAAATYTAVAARAYGAAAAAAQPVAGYAAVAGQLYTEVATIGSRHTKWIISRTQEPSKLYSAEHDQTRVDTIITIIFVIIEIIHETTSLDSPMLILPSNFVTQDHRENAKSSTQKSKRNCY
ncbi:hypothetical protein ALC60_13496 [Trachymyrmex zeteki]|uniref:Uncharacterized protein n=1 Tax=Mycetomoellerius zeteki TaxID=64791 RepID=A0A151WI17_9HYME|nr:hypothetical protein ALC60_13496 [Trachymyrmex zeteki]